MFCPHHLAASISVKGKNGFFPLHVYPLNRIQALPLLFFFFVLRLIRKNMKTIKGHIQAHSKAIFSKYVYTSMQFLSATFAF